MHRKAGMSATPPEHDLPEAPGRRGFARAVVGSALGTVAALNGMPAMAAPAGGPTAAPAGAEPGLPFHAWAPTPPMGWNSWDAFGASVTEAEYLDNARILAERFLPFGYEVATVDIQWYEPGAKSSWYRPFAPLVLDAHGRPQPAPNRFPSVAGSRGFAPLAAQVHAMGLRFGVHIMRGIPRQAVGLELPIAGSPYRCHEVANPGSTCAWNTDMCGVNPDHPGAFDWYRAWFAQLAEWGVDFVKVDDIAAPNYHAKEVALIRRAIDATGRRMVLSLSPGPALLDQAAHLQAHANQWRVCNDFWDTWPQLQDRPAQLRRRAAPPRRARHPLHARRAAADAHRVDLRAQPADPRQRPAQARRLDAAPAHQPRGAGTAARARHARMAQHGARPPLRLQRPAGHLGGVAEHRRCAVECVVARVAARRSPRLLGAHRPARRHPQPHRAAARCAPGALWCAAGRSLR
jgi:hypothetical protein